MDRVVLACFHRIVEVKHYLQWESRHLKMTRDKGTVLINSGCLVAGSSKSFICWCEGQAILIAAKLF